MGDKVLASVEIVAEVKGSATTCSPGEVRIPGKDEVDLRLVNNSDQQVTITAPQIFTNEYLVRFEGDPEVHVLRPVMAAGGGEIYRTEDGDVILRVTPHGGIIVYTRLHRTGAPASEEADVAPLAPEAVAQAAMRERLRELQAQAARSVGQQVTFDAPPQINGQASGVVLDAAERAAQGLKDAPLTTVRHVVITIGPQPGVITREETLTIQVAPQMGFAGRPSSATIRNVVTGQVQGPQQ